MKKRIRANTDPKRAPERMTEAGSRISKRREEEIPSFSVSPDAPPLTPEMVREAEEDCQAYQN
jgi:hypothetical protein